MALSDLTKNKRKTVERRHSNLRRRHSDSEHWIKDHWRPTMAWQYLIVCLFDFFAAPILLGFYAIWTKTTLIVWQPMTLQGGGMYHLAMGAIIGITSYGRTQEKLNGPGAPVLYENPTSPSKPETSDPER